MEKFNMLSSNAKISNMRPEQTVVQNVRVIETWQVGFFHQLGEAAQVYDVYRYFCSIQCLFRVPTSH